MYESRLEQFPNALDAAFKRANDISQVNSFGTLPPKRNHSTSQKEMKLESCRSDSMLNTGTWYPSDITSTYKKMLFDFTSPIRSDRKVRRNNTKFMMRKMKTDAK